MRRANISFSESENINHFPRDQSIESHKQISSQMVFRSNFDLKLSILSDRENNKKYGFLIQFQAEVTKNQSQVKRKYLKEREKKNQSH